MRTEYKAGRFLGRPNPSCLLTTAEIVALIVHSARVGNLDDLVGRIDAVDVIARFLVLVKTMTIDDNVDRMILGSLRLPLRYRIPGSLALAYLGYIRATWVSHCQVYRHKEALHA